MMDGQSRVKSEEEKESLSSDFRLFICLLAF